MKIVRTTDISKEIQKSNINTKGNTVKEIHNIIEGFLTLIKENVREGNKVIITKFMSLYEQMYPGRKYYNISKKKIMTRKSMNLVKIRKSAHFK